MILSASRRTDIPAFYSDWLFKRLDAGYVLTRNPFNYRQVSKIDVRPEVVDTIVFWTKNPRPMLNRLDRLSLYEYYFQFTLTPYGSELEKNLPENNELYATFQELAERIGKKRVIWRYDPIILTAKMNREYHLRQFREMAQELRRHTDRCVISFLELYRKTQRQLRAFDLTPPSPGEMRKIAAGFKEIAAQYDLELETCATKLDLTDLGISPGSCIDRELSENLLGGRMEVGQDRNQREDCNCAASIDIGAYNTCRHNCLYCYANQSKKSSENNWRKHDPASPFLLGQLDPEKDIVKSREMKSLLKEEQLKLFT